MSDPNDERPGDGAAPNRRNVLRTTETDGGVDASRRGVVAGAVASVAAALGLSGTAAAGVDPARTARLRRVEQRYSTGAVALKTLRDRGADVLDLLASEGHLERGDVAELGTPEVNGVETDGTVTGHVAAETDLDDGTLTVVVEPEADHQFAVLDRDGEDGVTVFDPESADEVHPNCPLGYGCEGGGCTCTQWQLTYCNDTCNKYKSTNRSCSDCVDCSSPACGY